MKNISRTKVRFERTEIFDFEFDEVNDPDLFVDGKLDKKKLAKSLFEDNIYGEDLYSICMEYSRNNFTIEVDELKEEK